MHGLRHHLLIRYDQNWGLLARFAIVGSSGVVVNLLVFGLLLAAAPEPQGIVLPIYDSGLNVRWYHALSTVAFVVANLWNFQLNRCWTFQSAGRAPWLREYGPVLTVGVGAQALGLLVLTTLLHPYSPVSLSIGLFDGSSVARSRELWAQAMTIAVVTPVSFAGNKLWTFRVVRGVPRRSRRSVNAAAGGDTRAYAAAGEERPRL